MIQVRNETAYLSFEDRYRIIQEKNPHFDRLFYTCVKTTGIFCRCVCPARTPLPQNVEFAETVYEAITKGYRPCKRCCPVATESDDDQYVHELIQLFESNPQKRIQSYELRQLGYSPEKARRVFQSKFGMSFAGYQRSRLLSEAMRTLREGGSVDETGLETGFSSSSGFRDAFQKEFGISPKLAKSETHVDPIEFAWLESPLGGIIAATYQRHLVLLEFNDRRMLRVQISTLQKHFSTQISARRNYLHDQIQSAIDAYFCRNWEPLLQLPILTPGSPFQLKVWQELRKIPIGETRTYAEIAQQIGSPGAQRAVGKANGENRLAILIPCHRVINSAGKLHGYGGGLWRKKALLELEAPQLSMDLQEAER